MTDTDGGKETASGNDDAGDRPSPQPGVPGTGSPGVPGREGGPRSPGVPRRQTESESADATTTEHSRSPEQSAAERDCGAFVCSCADTCSIDVSKASDAVSDVEVSAGSEMLCDDATITELASTTSESDLDDVVVTCPEPGAQEKLRRIEDATDAELHFIDQREQAGWVYDDEAATAATVRLLDARRAALDAPPHDDRRIEQEVGESVAVIGDAAFAADLSEIADVTLIADGEDFAERNVDLSGVEVQRGRVVDVDGRIGEFELAVEARVTEECISCMDCVHEGPDGMVTTDPVDIDPRAPDGEWAEVCPVDAIDMQGVEHEIKVDQVVSPGGESPIGGVRGFYTEPTAETMSEIRSYVGGIDEPAPLGLEMGVCAAGDAGQVGCTACTDACPHDAVSRPLVDEVEFDETLCQNCGACTSSCPTGAVSLREPSNERIAREVEQLVREPPEGGLLQGSDPEIDPQIVAFVCSERARKAIRRYGRLAAAGREDVEYPPILPVAVNCADTVGEAHVLHALAAGADGVAVVGCGGECLHSGPDPKEALVRRLNQATTDLGLGERVGFFAPDPQDPGAFVEELSRFALVNLDESPVPPGDHEATGTGVDDAVPFSTHAWALESVRTLLDHVEPERETVRGLESFGTIDVNDDCGLTPTCSNLCPTGALRREDNRLEFSHERCVNCGLCEDGCPEIAITMESGLDVEAVRSPEEWETAYEGELFPCRKCGEEFASVATVEQMKAEVPEGHDLDIEGHIFEYCSECKGNIAYGF